MNWEIKRNQSTSAFITVDSESIITVNKGYFSRKCVKRYSMWLKKAKVFVTTKIYIFQVFLFLILQQSHELYIENILKKKLMSFYKASYIYTSLKRKTFFNLFKFSKFGHNRDIYTTYVLQYIQTKRKQENSTTIKNYSSLKKKRYIKKAFFTSLLMIEKIWG